jgi:hypothetical protein
VSAEHRHGGRRLELDQARWPGRASPRREIPRPRRAARAPPRLASGARRPRRGSVCRGFGIDATLDGRRRDRCRVSCFRSWSPPGGPAWAHPGAWRRGQRPSHSRISGTDPSEVGVSGDGCAEAAGPAVVMRGLATGAANPCPRRAIPLDPRIFAPPLRR